MLRFFRVPILLKRRGRFLSATQAPVTGLTDILTPVNLLPNSDFSRDGGYADSIQIDSLNATEQTIRHNWCIATSVNTAIVTNITISYSSSDRSLTVSGHVQSADEGDRMHLRSISSFIPKGKTVTCSVNFECSNNITSLYPNPNTTTSVIYRSPDDGNSKTQIYANSSIRDTRFYIGLDLYSLVGEDFSFTITNASLYEGEFKNPPVTTSLDVKPGIGFITSPMSSLNLYPNTYSINFNSTGDSVGWYSICQLPYMSSGHTYFFEYFYSAYATGYEEAVLRLTVGYIWSSSKKLAYLDVEKTFNSSLLANVLDSFRIAYDSSKSRMYLQVHKNTTGVYVHSYLTQLIGADSRHANVTLYRGYVFNYAELNDSLTSVAVKTPRLIGVFS